MSIKTNFIDLSWGGFKPQQLRDAMPDCLPDHPTLQAKWQGKHGQRASPTHEDAQDRKNGFNAVVSAVSSRLGKPAEAKDT